MGYIDEDKRAKANFSRVSESVKVDKGGGEYECFPSRADYINYLQENGFIDYERELESEENSGLVLEIHRDWHRRAQQGCRFAAMLASRPKEFGWSRVVVSGRGGDDWSADQWLELGSQVEDYIDEPNVFATSVLFPGVTTCSGLLDLADHAVKYLDWNLRHREIETESGLFVNLALRISISDEVTAYPLGLGPLSFLATTRQSPITEIIFPTEGKSFPRRHEGLNEDPTIAHPADIPVPNLDDDAFNELWELTIKRKREMMYGRYESPKSKAKVTFLVPGEMVSY